MCVCIYIYLRHNVNIILFKPIAVVCGIDIILWIIFHIQAEYAEYSR